MFLDLILLCWYTDLNFATFLNLNTFLITFLKKIWAAYYVGHFSTDILGLRDPIFISVNT